MKIRHLFSNQRLTGRRSGFTLPELMIAMTVFIFLLGGIVFANLYGLSMFRITETKINATDDARRIVGKITDEIRTCKGAWVGDVKNGNFVGLLNGEKQQGSGLLISNATSCIIYFVNSSDNTFRRTTSKPGSAVILAECITNQVAFRAQDYLGNVATNNQNNLVFHFTLEFYQTKRRLQNADYYKLDTAVTRRATLAL